MLGRKTASAIADGEGNMLWQIAEQDLHWSSRLRKFEGVLRDFINNPGKVILRNRHRMPVQLERQIRIAARRSGLGAGMLLDHLGGKGGLFFAKHRQFVR